MVQCDDLWRPERYAVFDVESDVGHGWLPFYVDPFEVAPTRCTRGMMAFSTTYKHPKGKMYNEKCIFFSECL